MSETHPHRALFEEFSSIDLEEWKSHVQSDLGISSPDEFLEWSSLEGVTVPVYLHRDVLEEIPHVDLDSPSPPLGGAETAPANDWIVCQAINHPDPETAVQHARTAVEGGVDDVKLSATGAGDTGLTVRTPDDLTSILDGIDLSETGLHLDRGLAAPVLYGALREHLSPRELESIFVRGSVDFDPVAVFASGSGFDVKRLFGLADRLRTDFGKKSSVRSQTVDARVYHEAGASAVQELVFTLGALTDRLTWNSDHGVDHGTLSDDLQVITAVSTSYFVELAKLRALRLLVPQVVEAFADATDADPEFAPADLFVQVETSRRTETIYDPYVNMLRATTEAMTAVLGGCDMLTVRPYDAALRPPDDFGLRVARNTQLVLQHEAHLDQVADPAAGSYYVEALTDQLARTAWTKFQHLEADGGLVNALREGTLQQQIADVRQKRRDALDNREHVRVGTTHYPNPDQQRREHRSDPEAAFSSNGVVPHSLDTPSISAIRQALREGATVSEVTAAFRAGPSEIDPLPRIRVAEEIESIRLRTEEYAEAHDGPPCVLLAPLGPAAARSARSTFARNFLGVAGVQIEEPLKFDTVDEAAGVAVEHNADAVVLCSSDAEYDDLAPGLAAALVERNHDALVLVAGSPDAMEVDDAVDLFVHQDCPLKETLETFQVQLGVSMVSDPSDP